MFYGKKVFRTLILILATIICALSMSTFNAYAEGGDGLYLGGFPAGFVLDTTKVEVVGICEVLTTKGTCSPARDAGIKAGDIIAKINGENVTKSADINEFIARDYKKFEFTIIRGVEELLLEVNPVKERTSGGDRIGVLVKDSISGLGTVTYIDKTNGKFASLGHPVTENNGNLIKINGGTVYNGLIYDIKCGVRGTPGELRGVFESSQIGKAEVNCHCGVFGKLADGYNCSKLTKISTAPMEEVSIGTAYIYSTVYGKDVKTYKISIVKVDKHNKDNRNFVIKVDDKELLNKTGGIVQGMSGSPIVQNGKLIGAVTHVFINDPTRGYGIGIEKMMNAY